jgi:hypothetical protein
VEVAEGETLNMPETLTRGLGPGRWLITVQPAERVLSASDSRDHRAFLNSYSPEDEGLYDDAASR